VLLLITANRLLADTDTLWQITVGQWILDHHAVPETAALLLTLPHLSPGAAGDCGAGDVDRRAARRRRPQTGAATCADTADRTMGQFAWRLRLRPVLHRAGRARCAGECGSLRAPCAPALRWIVFAVVALAASCFTPYGSALLASQEILSLGTTLPLIIAWTPANFGSLGAFEVCLLLAIGFTLLNGIKLLPMRIVKRTLGIVANRSSIRTPDS
jgi:hypothetical protein